MNPDKTIPRSRNLAVRLNGGPNRDWSSAMAKHTPTPAAPPSADVPLNGHRLTAPGGVITYTGAHRRIYRARGSAVEYRCECGASAGQWSYIGGAPDEQVDELGRPYSGNPAMYKPLCVPCHKRADLAALGYIPSPCGTEKGYNRHRADGTPRCAPCKTAHAEYEAKRRIARQGR